MRSSAHPGSWRKSLFTRSSTVSSLSFCRGHSAGVRTCLAPFSVSTSNIVSPAAFLLCAMTRPLTQPAVFLWPIASVMTLSGAQTRDPTWWACSCSAGGLADILAAKTPLLASHQMAQPWKIEGSSRSPKTISALVSMMDCPAEGVTAMSSTGVTYIQLHRSLTHIVQLTDDMLVSRYKINTHVPVR